ncbi:MAG: hypothetical protein H0W37_12585, partial [Pseudonocardiales bacterium]|nr:hypothetical protein [Pseudonocardiales bacterium]
TAQINGEEPVSNYDGPVEVDLDATDGDGSGVRTTEVRVDGGEWQPARLAAPDGVDSWRQWVWEWQADTGSHNLEVRATDGNGEPQTSERVPPRPDGSSGYHAVAVIVA